MKDGGCRVEIWAKEIVKGGCGKRKAGMILAATDVLPVNGPNDGWLSRTGPFIATGITRPMMTKEQNATSAFQDTR